MKMDCIVKFEKHPETKSEIGIPENELWLDIGNALEPGCIDHHHVSGYASTLEAMVRHPEYLSAVKRCADEGQPVTVHLHIAPDLDCVASYYAFLYFLEHGEDGLVSFFGPGGEGRPFVEYINDIDAGRKKVTDRPTLYAVFSALDNGRERMAETDRLVLKKALELLELAIRLLQEKHIDLATYDLTNDLPDTYRKECREITSYSFDEELKNRSVAFETVPLWKRTGAGMVVELVNAAIWRKVPASSNSYNAARKRGALLTVVPYTIKGEDDAERTRVVISINPDLDPEHEYTLLPLAEIIEHLEQMEEERLYEQTRTYQRDHSQPRGMEELLGRMPFAATSDPWYIKPDEDYIDAPRNKSLLEYRDILDVIRHNGSAVKSACAVGISGTGRKILGQWKQIPLSTWQEEGRKTMSGEKEYVVVRAELEASLIRHNNRILEACCMNLTGRPLYERKSDNLYFVDYRTCVYANPDCTILLTATYGQQNTGELPVAKLAGMKGGGTPEDFCRSEFVENICTLLSQRERLLAYGQRIGETEQRNRKQLEQLNNDVIALSAEMQKDDMIDGAVEREQYEFIKKQFGIENLKTSVIEEMKMVIEESRNKMVARFNMLSAYAVPLFLFSALCEMGIIRFDALVDISGPAAVAVKNSGIAVFLGWLAVLGICGWLVLHFKRKK